jgi:hypothetical protein
VYGTTWTLSLLPGNLFTAGYAGPWIENTFRDYFVRLFEAGEDVGTRLYLPVMWFDCHFGCSKEQQEDLKGACMFCAAAPVCIVELPMCILRHRQTQALLQRQALCDCSGLTRVLRAVPGYLTQLRPEYTYFTVYIMDKGLEHMSDVVIPPSLDLLVFSCDATMRGLRTVPLPMLKQAS